jgi:alpha-tubulin suppressor-like RCC1 family protein
MDVPLTCTSTQCTGTALVIDSLKGTGSASFTVARSTDTLAPFPLNLLQDRQELATSRTHSLVVRNGQVWSFGWNREGQLGLGYKDTLFHPLLRQIPGLSRIVAVATGREFSVALDSSGDVWTWGSNFQGTLGNGTDDPNEVVPNVSSGKQKVYNSFFSNPVPQKVMTGQKVVSIAAGPTHVIASDTSGKAWGWGYNINGVVGMWTPYPYKLLTPSLIQGLTGIRRVTAGGGLANWETYGSFSIALGWDGTIWGMGCPQQWQLGPLVNVFSGPLQIILNLSTFPGLATPVSVRSGEAASLLEYVNTTTGQRLVLALGYNLSNSLTNSMSSNSVPTFFGTGPTSGYSLGGNVSVQIQSGLPTGAGFVWWQGMTQSSATLTGWTPVQTPSSQSLVAKGVRAGTNHGLSMDSSGNVICWGDATACTGGTGYVSVDTIAFDSLPSPTLQIDGLGDTLTVSSGTSILALTGKLNGVSTNISGNILCSNDLCLVDLVAKDPSGRFASKRVAIRKATLTSRSINLQSPNLSKGQSLLGYIDNPFLGTLSLSVWRVDVLPPRLETKVIVGAKTGSRLDFVIPTVDALLTGNGVYWVGASISGVGWNDSTPFNFSLPPDSTGILNVREICSDQFLTCGYAYQGKSPRLERVTRGNGTTRDTVIYATLFTDSGQVIYPGIVNLRTGAVDSYLGEYSVFWDDYYGGNAFNLSGAGPVNNLALSLSSISHFDGMALNLTWGQLNADSVAVTANTGNSNISFPAFTGNTSKSVTSTLGGSSSTGFVLVKIVAYKNGQAQTIWNAVKWAGK